MKLYLYIIVHNSLSPIQKGIQGIHACKGLQLSNYHDSMPIRMLDGGRNLLPLYEDLKFDGFDPSIFSEPDLNGTYTAIAVILNELNLEDDSYLPSIQTIKKLSASR